MLQKHFPDINGRPITWDPEKIYPAQGYYRSSNSCLNSATRWEAFAMSKLGNPILMVHCFETMTQILKAKRIEISSENEVSTAKEDDNESD